MSLWSVCAILCHSSNNGLLVYLWSMCLDMFSVKSVAPSRHFAPFFRGIFSFFFVWFHRLLAHCGDLQKQRRRQRISFASYGLACHFRFYSKFVRCCTSCTPHKPHLTENPFRSKFTNTERGRILKSGSFRFRDWIQFCLPVLRLLSSNQTVSADIIRLMYARVGNKSLQ